MIHYYSERGLVNCLIKWIDNKDDDYRNLRSFLQEIKYAEGEGPFIAPNGIEGIDVYNEFSFGEFGSPDLIIKVQMKKGNEAFIFMIESKINTFSREASIKEEKNQDIVYKDKASKIDIQLLLRKRFMDCLNNLGEKKDNMTISQEEPGYSDGKRKLSKKELVDWVYDNLRGYNDDNYYYVALTLEWEKETKAKDIWDTYIDSRQGYRFKEKINARNFGLLSWSWLNKYQKTIPGYMDTWELTSKKFK